MKVDGTRVEDLVGTGLVTKQRWVLPLWLSVPYVLGYGFGLAVGYTVRWAVRAWTLTVPAVGLLVVYVRWGGLAALVAWMWACVALLVWAYRSPASFDRLVTQRARGRWRWNSRYRRHWQAAMDGTGLTRMTPSRQVYVPTVTRVRSTAVVDTLHVRLLHGQTPLDLAQQAEGLRHVFGAHRCTVVEDAPGRVRVIFYARDPLTRTLSPLDPEASPRLSALPVGLAEDGCAYRLGLVGRHVLIAGASGAGKGSVLWSVVRALGPAVASGTVRLRAGWSCGRAGACSRTTQTMNSRTWLRSSSRPWRTCTPGRSASKLLACGCSRPRPATRWR